MKSDKKSMRGQGKRSAGKQTKEFEFAPWTELELSPVASPKQSAPKQSADVGVVEKLVALILIILVSPLMLLIVLAIKLDSPRGPILYRQSRVGLDRRSRKQAAEEATDARDRRRTPGVGRPFPIYKFRTMVTDAEESTGPVWAAENDPRVTRIGSVLRHLRLDELPQLFNVLRGEMRLIGPRPERPYFVSRLCEDIPEFPDRQKIPPGITGLAQVEKEYGASVDDVRKKTKYDIFYVRNRCKLLDIKILIKTIDVVLRGRGAR